MKSKYFKIFARTMLLFLGFKVFSGTSIMLYAQESSVYTRGASQMENTFPPAPESASVVKYVDTPVSYSQGLATLEIPFWTLEGRELKIPISFSYASGGIKVDEVAGVAGLGWNLNAGGCITRTVLDMPDEFSGLDFRHEMPSESLLEKLEDQVNDNETMNYLRDVLWHRVDACLDRYSYNVCGLSGTFVIKDDGSVFHLSGDGVKITPSFYTNGAIDYFTLLGPDGTIYRFSVKEEGHHDGSFDHQQTPTSGEPDRWDATTAWYLDTVTSRSGLETATFNYSSSQTWLRSIWTTTELELFRKVAYRETISRDNSLHFIYSSYDTKVLTSIEMSGYTATFNYSSDTGNNNHYVINGQSRQNFPYRLTSVSINYNNGDSIASVTVGTQKSHYDGRIILKSLRFYKGEVLDDRWDFLYDTLDSTISHYSQDWFGYYNGEDDSLHNRGGTCPFEFNNSSHGIFLTSGYPNPSKASYMSLLSADHDGAKTQFLYEGSEVDATGTGMDSITIGVRISKISVYDNGTLKRVRCFSYEDSSVDGISFPLANMYTTLNAYLTQDSSMSGPTITYHNWSFGLHDNPVVEGLTIKDSRALYGKVTEDVKNNNMQIPSVVIISPHTGITPTYNVHRIVRYFSTSNVRGPWTSTISRFPSRWIDDYRLQSVRPNAVDPYTGIRDSYLDNGPATSPLLTREEEYTHEDGTFKLVSATDYTYGSDLQKEAVVTEYRATQVMQRLGYGNLQMDDIYHYPVYTCSNPCKVPILEHHVEYHADSSESNYDEKTISKSYVIRSNLSEPVRVGATSMTESGLTRSMTYTYPDTWPGGNVWVSALKNSHALNLVLRKDFRTTSSGQPAKSEIIEYDYFTVNNIARLLPSSHKELTYGVESWKEQFKTRDCLGNISSLKETGKPETTIIWSWNGCHPAAVIENAGISDVTTSIGSQNVLDAITRAAQPSSEQISSLESMREMADLNNSHISTFTWSPGIGLTSIANPAGHVTTYEYDSHGRLEYVKDNEGKTVQGYSYNLLNDGSGHLSVRNRTYRSASGNDYFEDVRWFNTLGMRIEDIAIDGACNGMDLVTAREGDFMLHDDVKIWLPYPTASTGGLFQTDAETEAESYHTNSLAYFSKKYEKSSRDRVLSSALPGYAGAHETSYSVSSLSEIPIFTWGTDGPVQNGTFELSSLVKETVVDPDGLITYTIKDHAGRTVASGSGTDAPTYYVYDCSDRLQAVIGGGIEYSDTLSMWRYSYDTKGRLSSKGIPGSEREFYDYYADNTSESYNGMLRYRYRGNERTEFIYDDFGRIIQEKLKIGNAQDKVVTENTYDSYPSSLSALISSATGSPTWNVPAKGLKTSTMSAMIDGEGTINEVYSTRVWLYDERERPIWVITGYSDGSILKEHLSYDFCGNVVSNETSYTRNGNVDILSTENTYDIRGRMTAQTSSLSSGGFPVSSMVTQYSYDALGRPSGSSTSVDGGITVNTEDSYNLQQWLISHSVTRGSSMVYTESLGYDSSPAYGDIIALHNGLITKRTDSWSYPGGGLSSRTFGYSYDESGRLAREHGPSMNVSFSYDSRSNITSLTGNYGHSESFTYLGDRLVSMTKQGETVKYFTYDDYGRMIYDGTEGVDINYNYLDLPRKILSTGITRINYCYLADGTKVSALSVGGQGLVYRGPFIYRKTSGGTFSLESADCASGKFTPCGTLLYVTDHLGSIVGVMRAADGMMYEASEYEAYGKRSSLTSVGTIPLPSGLILRDHFAGKEDQSPDFNLAYTDFGMRQYSPTQHRWLVPDPLSEKYYGISPYAYCAGNPISIIDKDGAFLDAAWDVTNVVLDIKSFISNISEGNVTGAVVDGISTAFDVAAAVIPVVPAGAGAAVKAARKIDKVAETATSFTKRNFRKNLSKLTGVMPEGKQAHHMLPQKFEDKFNNAGIDIHNPKYGYWLESHKHNKGSYQYNKGWGDFFDANEGKQISDDDIIKNMKKLMEEVYEEVL